jgi:hypothetical protein
MFYEHGTCRGFSPWSAAHRSPREGVGFHHARRPLWTGPLSFEVVLRMPRAAATRPKSSKNSGASITRPAPVTTCATGSQATPRRRERSSTSWPTCSSGAVTQMPPDNVKGRPPVTSQQGGPDACSANITATSITRRPVKGGQRRVGRRTGRWPVASASLYEPACDRRWWWISLRCPWCGSVHLHRVRREEDAGGVRRTGCGRRVYVKIRTTYRGTPSGRAA